MKYSIPRLNSISASLPALLGCALFTFLLLLLATPRLNEGHRHGKNIRAKPKAISKPLPVFKSSMSTGLNPRKALEEALRHTVPAQDPGFYTERENLLSLLRSLRNDPCNDDLRKNYAGAVKTFEIVIDKDWDRVPREQWKETIDAYGTLMNTSGHFNQPIIQEIQESILEGFLSSDEISKNYRATKNDSRFYNARQKSCSNNTAYISPLEEEYWDNYRRSAYDMFEDFFFGYFYMSDTEEEKQEQEEQEEPDEWEEEQEEKYEPD